MSAKRKRKPVEAGDGSYGGTVLAAFDQQRHLVYTDQHGKAQCVNAAALVELPSGFVATLLTLSVDLELAIDCLHIFGGVPVPVAKAILRNIEPARAAIDMAVRGSQPKAQVN